MVKLSVNLADSAAKTLEEQLRAACDLGIHNLELTDLIDGLYLDQMTGAELERVRSLLIDWNVRVVLLHTSIPAGDHERLKLLFRKALQLDVEAVQMDVSEGDDTAYAARLAESYGMPLYVENQFGGTFCDETKLLKAVRERGMKVIFNPLEFVKYDRHPFFHAFYNSKIKNDIGFLRINDGLFVTHEPMPLGHGCAEVKELTSILISRSFDGYFSFVSYRPEMDLEAYRAQVDAFKNLLKHC